MTTFEELNERTTPDIIKKMVELAEALIYCYRLIKTTGLSIPQVSAIIESVTGKSIEEVL